MFLLFVLPLLLGQTEQSLFSSKQLEEAKMLDSQAAAAKEKHSVKDNYLYVIDPQKRSGDWVEAYHMLRKDKGATNIKIHVKGHQPISRIAEIKALDGGTLVMLLLNTAKGQSMEFIRVEDIEGISF